MQLQLLRLLVKVSVRECPRQNVAVSQACCATSPFVIVLSDTSKVSGVLAGIHIFTEMLKIARIK